MKSILVHILIAPSTFHIIPANVHHLRILPLSSVFPCVLPDRYSESALPKLPYLAYVAHEVALIVDQDHPLPSFLG
ncbi:hypothetical protein Pelo_1560 [Pelomyxa schiedti]|nr:hypothetical protein Pelo_1560 [Pelomyxa schiedti]